MNTKSKKMMNSGQYENLISLLEKALEFYAKKDNYLIINKKPALIDIDEHGSQARFALDKIRESREIQGKLEADYEKLANNVTQNLENPETMLNAIKTIKNIGND